MAIPPKKCAVCGAMYSPRSWNSKMTPLCSPDCKRLRRESRCRQVTLPCKQCGVLVTLKGRELWRQRTGAVYCTRTCASAQVSAISSAAMAAYNRAHASQRMKERNPMHHEGSRAKMRQALLDRGHRPAVRGGNGQGPSIPQRMLAEVLDWPMEVAIRTRAPRGSGYPTCYKVDVALQEARIAIEIDGSSHASLKRQQEDAKKEALLNSLGWTVFRFTNADVMASSIGCVREIVSSIWRSKASTTTSPTAS
jgi:hypothetical protein